MRRPRRLEKSSQIWRKFVYRLIQQISMQNAYYTRCWGFRVELITVLHSQQSLSASDTNFDTMLDIPWTAKVISNLLKVLNRALQRRIIAAVYHPLPE